LIGFTRRAIRQLEELQRHYEERERFDALRNLDAAISEAMLKIEQSPGAGLAAPRPYPFLAAAGRAWIKAGRYWIMYSTRRPPTITGIFYEAADIPGRISK